MGDRGEISNLQKNKKQPKRKIIIMGKSNSGKTSIFSVIFTHIYPIETFLFEHTNSISLNKILFSGGESIELNDCGGEEKYIQDYLTIKKDIFKNVLSFIFVINAENQKLIIDSQNQKNDPSKIALNPNNDIDFLQQCISLLNKSSPFATIFILMNKMDKISMRSRKLIFEKKKQEIMEKMQKIENFNSKNKIKFYGTSIWDDSLYVPWKEIMSDRVIKNTKIQKGLKFLLEACDADEIFLIEKNTFLCIESVDNGKNEQNEERMKKISFLIKKFKQTLWKNKADFSCIKIKMNNIMVYFEEFMKYSYIMIINQRPKINCAFVSMNVSLLKQKFTKSK